jgi:hypothetical protein
MAITFGGKKEKVLCLCDYPADVMLQSGGMYVALAERVESKSI